MKTSTRSRSDASKIPRPMNSFMIYRLEKQREIVKECPGANHRDISKIIAKWWKEMSDEEKQPYRTKALMARHEHSQRYPDYKFCPQKKAKKPRTYKKRPKNEFTAIDFESRRQLIEIYHRPVKSDEDNSSFVKKEERHDANIVVWEAPSDEDKPKFTYSSCNYSHLHPYSNTLGVSPSASPMSLTYSCAHSTIDGFCGGSDCGSPLSGKTLDHLDNRDRSSSPMELFLHNYSENDVDIMMVVPRQAIAGDASFLSEAIDMCSPHYGQHADYTSLMYPRWNHVLREQPLMVPTYFYTTSQPVYPSYFDQTFY
ncbi:hypothetical protein RMATCC62417_12945 [Rhizopus microsporus]|nr:hypothetical protein RMATCC62417_12945 [Rhizopus microsporus]